MPRDEEAEGGLDPQIVVFSVYSAYRAFQDVLGNPTTEIEELPSDHVEGWMAAVNAGSVPILDSEDSGGAKWGDVAQAMYAAFAEATGEQITFGKSPGIVQLMWEAVARHLANMLAYDKNDPDGEIEEHVEKIAAWFETKANELGERLLNESDSEGQACQASPLALAAQG